MQTFISQRIALGLAFSAIPENSQEMMLFRLAYSYRHHFDDLAEYGSEHDPKGLQAAVTRALSYSVGFTLGGSGIYRKSGRGVDTVDLIEDYLEKGVDHRQFKAELYDAAIKLPGYVIERFFSSLGEAVIDRIGAREAGIDEKRCSAKTAAYNRHNLEQAVKESLLNYARTARLGLYVDEKIEVPLRSHKRIKITGTTESLSVHFEEDSAMIK